MKMKNALLFLIAFAVLLSTSCSRKSVVTTSPGKDKPMTMTHNALPPCIIYKTKADYSKQVPVALSSDKSTIASYPDVRDIFINGTYPYPTKLDDGFLLDNRGVGPDVAFLDYTYEAYHNLGKTPTMDDLLKHIEDKNPLVALYQCGNKSQYADLSRELNVLIHAGFKNCKRLK
jgi:hypothetical protein